MQIMLSSNESYYKCLAMIWKTKCSWSTAYTNCEFVQTVQNSVDEWIIKIRNSCIDMRRLQVAWVSNIVDTFFYFRKEADNPKSTTRQGTGNLFLQHTKMCLRQKYVLFKKL